MRIHPTTDLPLGLAAPECKEVLHAMSWCADKWRHSITHMRRQGREDEATRLAQRLRNLDDARDKLRPLLRRDHATG